MKSKSWPCKLATKQSRCFETGGVRPDEEKVVDRTSHFLFFPPPSAHSLQASDESALQPCLTFKSVGSLGQQPQPVLCSTELSPRDDR